MNLEDIQDNTEFILNWPGKIVFRAGCLADLGQQAKLLGRHAFLVTTQDLSKLGVTQRACQYLKQEGIKVTFFEDVQPDPTSVAVDGAAELAQSAGCDLIISVGGGSAIDFGKALAVAVTHEGPIWDYVTYTGANAKQVTSNVLPLIAIPTTAGTGSEVSLGTVLDNPIKHMKAALLSPNVYPKIAMIDPELTYTMPPHITAMTGFDALTHGVESFLNTTKSNPASEVFALYAVQRIVHFLPKAVADGNDHQARRQMSWAATAAGIAMALSNVTVAHAMGLPLGSRVHVPHGLGLARLLPVVMEHSYKEQPRRYADLADHIGVVQANGSVEEKAKGLITWLVDFIANLGLDALWKGYAIDDAMLDLLTDDVFAYMGRPVQQHKPVFDRAQVKEIYKIALI